MYHMHSFDMLCGCHVIGHWLAPYCLKQHSRGAFPSGHLNKAVLHMSQVHHTAALRQHRQVYHATRDPD
jgi:hypothetical protein